NQALALAFAFSTSSAILAGCLALWGMRTLTFLPQSQRYNVLPEAGPNGLSEGMNGLQNYPKAPRLRYLFALTLVSGLAGGVAFDRHVLSHFIPTGNVPSNAISDFRLMAEAWNTIHEFFVGRT